MNPNKTVNSCWNQCRIGITGANGSLGRAITKSLCSKGALITGFTHGSIPKETSKEGPQEWIQWSCGKEKSLDPYLSKIDILIINHGINPKGGQSPKDFSEAIEVNALSSWRLIKRFEQIALESKDSTTHPKEIWINTSEAEIQPAFSPAYELSKRLLGQLVSFRWVSQSKSESKSIVIRKLILGPFKSELNPYGIMNPNWVAMQILRLAELNLKLIIITPNPFTYIFMPITELCRYFYSLILIKRGAEGLE